MTKEETGGEIIVKEGSFQMFPEGSDRGAASYMEGERVPKSRCIMTERIQKYLCDLFTLRSKVGYEGT